MPPSIVAVVIGLALMLCLTLFALVHELNARSAPVINIPALQQQAKDAQSSFKQFFDRHPMFHFPPPAPADKPKTNGLVPPPPPVLPLIDPEATNAPS